MEIFIEKEPKAEKFFQPWLGITEFMVGRPKYCLWLGDCWPEELQDLPECRKRVSAVALYRLNLKSESAKKLAMKATRFKREAMYDRPYIAIPSISSRKRRYIPIGWMVPDILCGRALYVLPNVSIYHFGVLHSNVHNAWMHSQAKRSSYNYYYRPNDVYNTFPWPTPTEEQKEEIRKSAQGILSMRQIYSDYSMMKLYDPNTMPVEVLKAHYANDRAVMAAYGFSMKMSESDCIEELKLMYHQIIKWKNKRRKEHK